MVQPVRLGAAAHPYIAMPLHMVQSYQDFTESGLAVSLADEDLDQSIMMCVSLFRDDPTLVVHTC
jgi:hypothetical protein